MPSPQRTEMTAPGSDPTGGRVDPEVVQRLRSSRWLGAEPADGELARFVGAMADARPAGSAHAGHPSDPGPVRPNRWREGPDPG